MCDTHQSSDALPGEQPNPYAARGNAKDAGTNYSNQGIGYQLVKDDYLCKPILWAVAMDIWVDLAGEANYESNGATGTSEQLQTHDQFLQEVVCELR